MTGARHTPQTAKNSNMRKIQNIIEQMLLQNQHSGKKDT